MIAYILLMAFAVISAFLAALGFGAPFQSPRPWQLHLGWLAVFLYLLATLLNSAGVMR